ncbi:hypothetical protein EOA79_02310 [Mesorhizobium sp. M1A.F.Ca.IN.020.03.2.1]|nr:hypothetical protein EOA79_02310 [Mesorhizobium sp. M1A.F.Ca.IN.020.03.2.1]
MATDREMPRYQCHKKVWALKIERVDESQTLYPVDKGYAPIRVSDEWLERYRGSDQDPGYYVVYDDGFSSWSPTKAFEGGYTRL